MEFVCRVAGLSLFIAVERWQWDTGVCFCVSYKPHSGAVVSYRCAGLPDVIPTLTKYLH